jgi:hypothetical protein
MTHEAGAECVNRSLNNTLRPSALCVIPVKHKFLRETLFNPFS